MRKAMVVLATEETGGHEDFARSLLVDRDFDAIVCTDGVEALQALQDPSASVLITDLRMPGQGGMNLIDQVVDMAPHVAVIVIADRDEIESAVESMKKGARDFICKPINPDDLAFRTERALAGAVLAKENKALREMVKYRFEPIATIGTSAAVRYVTNRIDELGQSREHVLISGERGTRKEDIARSIHHAGDSFDRPFVVASGGRYQAFLPPSENGRSLFIEEAAGGTLFFGEISDVSLENQAELLRAIEGGDCSQEKADSERTRVIAATRADLARRVGEGVFNPDLLNCLQTTLLRVPPLRDRVEDIQPLVVYLLERVSGEVHGRCPQLAGNAINSLRGYSWPGNVRELEAIIRRAMLLANGGDITADMLDLAQSGDHYTPTVTTDLRTATRAFERQHISAVLASVGNRKHEAARVLGIGLSSLYRKLDDLKTNRASTPNRPSSYEERAEV